MVVPRARPASFEYPPAQHGEVSPFARRRRRQQRRRQNCGHAARADRLGQSRRPRRVALDDQTLLGRESASPCSARPRTFRINSQGAPPSCGCARWPTSRRPALRQRPPQTARAARRRLGVHREEASLAARAAAARPAEPRLRDDAPGMSLRGASRQTTSSNWTTTPDRTPQEHRRRQRNIFEGSKHRSRGAVSRVAGARHACFALCSRKSHAPRLRSPLATRLRFSNPGPERPPSQHRPGPSPPRTRTKNREIALELEPASRQQGSFTGVGRNATRMCAFHRTTLIETGAPLLMIRAPLGIHRHVEASSRRPEGAAAAAPLF